MSERMEVFAVKEKGTMCVQVEAAVLSLCRLRVRLEDSYIL
jgi:hypothetical protein